MMLLTKRAESSQQLLHPALDPGIGNEAFLLVGYAPECQQEQQWLVGRTHSSLFPNVKITEEIQQLLTRHDKSSSLTYVR